MKFKNNNKELAIIELAALFAGMMLAIIIMSLFN